MLSLGIDADRMVAACVDAGEKVENLLERRDFELAVVGGATQLRDALLRAQRLQLGKGEILGEPAGDRLAVDAFRRLAARKFGMAGNAGRLRNFILVPRAQYSAPGSMEERRVGETGARTCRSW